jgi:hypothetical protein
MFDKRKVTHKLRQSLVLTALAVLVLLVLSQLVLVETGCSSCSACLCHCEDGTENGTDVCLSTCDPNFGECFDNSCIATCAGFKAGCFPK